MRPARLWPLAVVAVALLALTGCAENEVNPFDPSQDPDPPEVTAFSYSNGTATWTTDEPALCVLEYGPVDGEFRNYVYESTKTHTEDHEVRILGMEDGETYMVRIRSMDRAGNEDYVVSDPAFDRDEPSSMVSGVAFNEPFMRLSMIDVGWGLSMTLETPGGTQVIIDAGSDDHLNDVKDFLYEHDLTYFDYAVATHHHADHTGGFYADNGVLDNFVVGTFIVPDETYILDSIDWYLLDELEDHSLVPVEVKQGDDSSNHEALAWDDTPGFNVQVLSAGVGTQFETDPELISEDAEGNNDSVVLRLTYGDVAFLTMGDAEFFVERYIVDYYGRSGVRADLLQVAHHANDDGTSKFWLDNVDPRMGFISNAMIEAALEKEVVLQGLRSVNADYMATDRIVPNTPRDVEPTYGHLIAVTDGNTIEVITEEHDW